MVTVPPSAKLLKAPAIGVAAVLSTKVKDSAAGQRAVAEIGNRN